MEILNQFQAHKHQGNLIGKEDIKEEIEILVQEMMMMKEIEEVVDHGWIEEEIEIMIEADQEIDIMIITRDMVIEKEKQDAETMKVFIWISVTAVKVIQYCLMAHSCKSHTDQLQIHWFMD